MGADEGWLPPLLLKLKNKTIGIAAMSNITRPPMIRFLGVSAMLGGRGYNLSLSETSFVRWKMFLPHEGQIEEEGLRALPQKGHLPSSRLIVVLLFLDRLAR